MDSLFEALAKTLLNKPINDPDMSGYEYDIIREEATLVVKAILQLPERNPNDFAYLDECLYYRQITDVFDELFARRDWLSVLATYRVADIVVPDLSGVVLFRIEPRTGEHCVGF